MLLLLMLLFVQDMPHCKKVLIIFRSLFGLRRMKDFNGPFKLVYVSHDRFLVREKRKSFSDYFSLILHAVMFADLHRILPCDRLHSFSDSHNHHRLRQFSPHCQIPHKREQMDSTENAFQISYSWRTNDSKSLTPFNSKKCLAFN